MIIPFEAGKAFDKIQYSCLIKSNSQQVRKRGDVFVLIASIYRTTASARPNDARVSASPKLET